MAYGFVTADTAAWATALAQYQTAHAAFTSLPDGSERSPAETLSDELVNAETALLDLHSPDLAAVVKKLEILWDEDELYADTEVAEHRRLVIGDLHRIAFQQ